MNTIYTTGYAGRQPAALLQIAGQLGAVIVDIRFNAVSRMPQWNRPALVQTFGKCYCHVPQLGNVNYGTGGPIEISEPVAGLNRILHLAEQFPLILICGCRDLATCHRRNIADVLRGKGVDCRELEWPVEDAPPGKVKCISLWQPHASLFGRGKLYETRSWPTRYRGPLAIHAGKNKCDLGMIDFDNFVHEALTVGVNAIEPESLPLGAIVAVGNLTECRETGEWCDKLPAPACYFGDFSPGRFAWKVADVIIFPQPIPCRGQQGLFDVEMPSYILRTLAAVSA